MLEFWRRADEGFCHSRQKGRADKAGERGFELGKAIYCAGQPLALQARSPHPVRQPPDRDDEAISTISKVCPGSLVSRATKWRLLRPAAAGLAMTWSSFFNSPFRGSDIGSHRRMAQATLQVSASSRNRAARERPLHPLFPLPSPRGREVGGEGPTAGGSPLAVSM